LMGGMMLLDGDGGSGRLKLTELELEEMELVFEVIDLLFEEGEFVVVGGGEG